ncbi:MFS transporter [Candidatus Fermentibacteria bacterium]|nr:MFS transporter [Candidatus Fermentibacteria bacterium]
MPLLCIMQVYFVAFATFWLSFRNKSMSHAFSLAVPEPRLWLASGCTESPTGPFGTCLCSIRGRKAVKRLKSLGTSPEVAWCLYDWANSSFVTTITAAVLPVYFARVVCGEADVHWSLLGRQLTSGATSLWGYAMALAALLVAVLSPLFGAAADAGGRRKLLTGLLTGLGVASAALLAFFGSGDVWPVLLLLVTGQIGFAGSNVFYNSLLLSAASPERRDVVSAKGFAFGYLGGGILLALNLLLIANPGILGLQTADQATRVAFASVAVWWALFSIPLFLFVPEGPSGSARSIGQALREGLSTLAATLRNLSGHDNAFRFLLSYLLYNDGIQTVIIMATIFGKSELGLDDGDLIGALLLTQGIGVPASVAYGRLAQRFGARRMLFAGITGYLAIVLYAYRMQTATEFWVLAGAVGLLQGGVQAVSRSYFAGMIPRRLSAEYFGFFSISTRFASIFGPLIFALIADITDSARGSILALAVFFLAGGALLSTVREERKR